METRLLTILRRISEIIAGSDEHGVMLDKIVDVLAESLKVEVCSIYVHQPASDELELAATRGLSKSSVGQVRMKTGSGLVGASFLERRIFNLKNPGAHPNFLFFADTGEENYKSFLSVPLTAGGHCVGILVVQRAKPERFPPPVVDMVKSLSTQLANLVLNYRMLKVLSQDGEAARPATEPKGAAEQVMLRGVAANDGIAKGNIFLFESRNYFDEIAHETTEDSEGELKLLEQAIQMTKEQTIELEKRALSMISEADASIFNVHLMFLEDKSFIDEIRREITVERHTVEFGVKQIFGLYHRRFIKMADPVFREKEMDLKDVMLRMLESVRAIRAGEDETTHSDDGFGEGRIIVANELLPSDLIRLPVGGVMGIVCEKGGITAHVAILAKALDIPALMGVGNLEGQAANGDPAILDCHAELFYIRPAPQVVQHFDEMTKAGFRAETAPDPAPALTLDGTEIIMRANISLVCETSLLEKYGASGIGLYRTEFLYMIRDSSPSEEVQYQVYSRIIKAGAGQGVTIRLLDVGGDKPVPYIDFGKEANPAMGNRGIRLLLSRMDIFKTQIRAALRAGVHGPLRILAPMVASTSEIITIQHTIDEVENELHSADVPHAENYKVGIMIEVPSIVFGLESIIDNIDYASIGSNDLLQYVFAADRGNERVADNFQPLNPVFLGVLRTIGDVFRRHPEKDLAICGEMAGNVLATPFLVGAGIKELSMSPRQIPAVKNVVRSFSVEECRALLDDAVGLRNPEAVACLVKQALNDKNLNGWT